MSKTGQTVSFTYGVDGLRLSKTITENGTSSTVKYYYNGSSLTDVIYADGNRLHIIYDGSGSPLGFTYQNQIYFYEKNLQGDILGIKCSSGNVTVSYTYDSWGKITSQTNSNLAKINPLRYRGYVYDEETGFYISGTRYYDPEISRFINADSLILGTGESVQGYNLFACCHCQQVIQCPILLLF